MDRLRVGIIFGGCSEEHPISVKSAQEVAKNLDVEKYEPFYIGITKSGAWKLCDGPDAAWENGSCRPVVLSPDRSVHGLLVLEQDRYKMIRLDVVFPVLHGKFGEDGAMQGLLELSGIPYAGCDVQSSALCMDKSLAYIVAGSAGIATPKYWAVTANEKIDPDRPAYPVFVKPARSGSSFGVSRVARKEELLSAVETARQYDSKVLIEEAVVGSEVGCAILGERFGLVAGEVDRISLSHGFFRIHQESAPESGSENSTAIVPADISAESRSLVQETAKAVYRALGCRGLARVDMFLKEDGTVVLNEVNTLPGMTSYSRYPRMMAAAGLPLAEVIDRIVWLTLHGKRR
ncbi:MULTISPECIES: D-alanine--(R)-lactate ligase [unclassified Pseudofrankia]|uniref:D-alanine--(R)-lactate ligase n=1 Tax=unclassified Pseudofrankia TaxID=2994372 RepID=UPI0008DB010F|nr:MULTISPECIES: D-alanine--(R)-lactate ligase [unclassified Pseudofrankia]MDT3442885.1 D-alanine--(R)-lactate ligase [Pseudofrankia sp. BMG5.37]OHV59264.1 D-alanine--(R)-lactate ligase [Pseudofrankia sp. BMG5.36]